jgi:hypothetical protein
MLEVLADISSIIQGAIVVWGACKVRKFTRTSTGYTGKVMGSVITIEKKAKKDE